MEGKVYNGIEGLFEALSDLTHPYNVSVKKQQWVDTDRYDIIEKPEYKKNALMEELNTQKIIKKRLNAQREELVNRVDKCDAKIKKLEEELETLD